MIRRLFAFAILAAATCACQVTVQISTTLNEDGGGTLRIATILDKELRQRLESSSREAAGLDSVEGLFARLHAAGWTTDRTEPGGGLAMSASRTFADSAGFDRTISELRSSSSEASQGGIGLALDYATSKSFLTTKSTFSGTIDTNGEGLDPELRPVLKQLAPFVKFEIRTRLPGGADDVKGGGETEGGDIVWRPELGSELEFSATSSSLRTTSVLIVIVPILAGAGALAWIALGRRKHEDDLALTAIIPDEQPSGDQPV